MKLSNRNARIGGGVGIAALAVLGVLWFLPQWHGQSRPSPKPSGSSSPITSFDGTLDCLPPKNSNGPATTECAYGLKVKNGDYYALDTIMFPGSSFIASLPTGTKVTVTGVVTPKAKLPDNQLANYAIQGVIRVADVQEK